MYVLYKKLRQFYAWFFRDPLYHGLCAALALPLLLPFTFVLRVYNTPPSLIAMLLFNGIVEVSLLYYILFILYRKTRYPYATLGHIFLIILLSAVALSSVLGMDVSRSFFGDTDWGDGVWFLLHLYAYAFLLTWILPKKRHWEFILRSVSVLACIIAILGVSELLFPFLLYPDVPVVSPLYLGLGNPDYLAQLFLLLIFPPMYGYFSTNGFKRIFYGAVISLLYFGIILTNSTSASGLATGAILVFLFFALRRRVIILTLTYGVFFVAMLYKGIVTAQFWNGVLNSFMVRFFAWKILMRAAGERFFFGFGWHNALPVWFKFYDPVVNFFQPGSFEKAHNILVEYAVTTGLIGLLAFFAFWGYLLLRLYKRYRVTKEGVYVLLCALFIINILYLQFNFDTIVPYIYTYLFVGGSFVLADGKRVNFAMNSVLSAIVVTVFSLLLLFSLLIYTILPLYAQYKIMHIETSLYAYFKHSTSDFNAIRPDLLRIARYKSPYYGVADSIARLHSEVKETMQVSESDADALSATSREVYKEIIRKHPWNPFDYLHLAILEKSPHLSPYLKEAETVSPAHGYMQYQIGLYAFEGGDYQEAYTRLNAVEKTNFPRISLFYAGLARIGEGEIKEGEIMVLTSLTPRDYPPVFLSYRIRVLPASPTAEDLERLAILYGKNDRKEQLAYLLGRMISLQSENSTLYEYLIRAFKGIGKEEEVRRVADYAEDKFPAMETFRLKKE